MRATRLRIPTPPHKNHLFMSCRYQNEYLNLSNIKLWIHFVEQISNNFGWATLEAFFIEVGGWSFGNTCVCPSGDDMLLIAHLCLANSIHRVLQKDCDAFERNPQCVLQTPTIWVQFTVDGSSIIALSRGVSWFLHHQRRLNFIFVKSSSTFVTSFHMWINISRNFFCTCLSISWILKVQHSSVCLLSFNSSIDSSCSVANPQESRRDPLTHSVTFGGSAKLNKSTNFYYSAWRFNSRHFCNGLWVWGC